jgi:hypothetical protein
MNPILKRAIGAIIAIAGAAIVLSACGGAEPSAEDAQANAQDAALEYAGCMRDHGIDMPDPQPGESGNFSFQGGNFDPESAAFRAASDACDPILQQAVPEGERPDSADFQDKLHERAKCMRDKGYDVPEPQGQNEPSLDSATEESGESVSDPQIDDPEFQRAMTECSKEAGLPAAVTTQQADQGSGGGPAVGIDTGP